jgi:hypothetical protein
VSKSGHVALGINDGTLSIRSAKVLYLFIQEFELSYLLDKKRNIMDLSIKIFAKRG